MEANSRFQPCQNAVDVSGLRCSTQVARTRSADTPSLRAMASNFSSSERLILTAIAYENEGSYFRSGPHGTSAEMSPSHSAQAGCARLAYLQHSYLQRQCR